MILVLLVAMALAVTSLAILTLNFMTAQRLERWKSTSNHSPRVTLMIPFRNEAENLKRTLPFLRKIQYPGLKVLLLNDQSEDIGPYLAQDIALHDPDRFRVVDGKPLPEGWVGKNWACHQLSELEVELSNQSDSGATDSDILIFCDADVEVGPQAVMQTVAAMEGLRADALTAFLGQKLETWSEKAIIPLVMQLSIFSLLPLHFLPIWRSPAAVVSNGQWFAFRRSAYRSVRGHAGVKAKVLEDMELGRRLHIRKLKLIPVVSNLSLQVRMYHSWDELRAGFGKNLSSLTGGGIFGALFASGWILLSWMIAPLTPLGFLVVFMQRVLLVRIFSTSARASLESIALHWVGAALTIYLIFYSYVVRVFGRSQWKGRSLADF